MARYQKNRFGSIVLQDDKGNDFTITKKEQQELKTLVKRANQRRTDRTKKYHKMVAEQRNMKGVSVDAYKGLLEYKGFITEKYSTKASQFKSKADLKDFLSELRQVTKRGYGDKRIENIRESMIKRVRENYGHDSQTLEDKINSINDGELLSIYIHNDDLIRDIYGSDIGFETLDELRSKTLSDINFALHNI